MMKRSKILLNRPVEFSDFLDTNSEYFEKMMSIIKDKPYERKQQKGYNLHHTIPRSISKYFGEEPQNDKCVLLTIEEHFLVHYYMDKCRLDGFGHNLAPSWRLILSNNRSSICEFVTKHGELGALLLAEILNTKHFNFSKKDSDNYKNILPKKDKEWYKKRAEIKLQKQMKKFFDENIPTAIQDIFIDFVEYLDLPFSVAQVRKIWDMLTYMSENPDEAMKVFYILEHLTFEEYDHLHRSQATKNSYTPELRAKRSEDNKRRSKEIYKKIGDKARGRVMSEESKRKNSESHKGIGKGKKWYNNGVKSVMCYECPEGYVIGRLIKKELNA